MVRSLKDSRIQVVHTADLPAVRARIPPDHAVPPSASEDRPSSSGKTTAGGRQVRRCAGDSAPRRRVEVRSLGILIHAGIEPWCPTSTPLDRRRSEAAVGRRGQGKGSNDRRSSARSRSTAPVPPQHPLPSPSVPERPVSSSGSSASPTCLPSPTFRGYDKYTLRTCLC